MENPYHILGISPTATNDEIKKAYRSLAMRHHPDRNTHPGTEGRFNAIQSAYELLSDPTKRTEYQQQMSQRIIIDPDHEVNSLWQALFNRCGMQIQQ